MPRVELWLDGGGVFPDIPLAFPLGSRFRLKLNDDPSQDLTIWVEGGKLKVAAQYGETRAVLP